MSGKAIGKRLNHGFAGSYARQPDMIIQTRPNNSTDTIVFGSVLMNDSAGGVVPANATFTAAKFAGIAGKELKTALDYLDQDGGGQYYPQEPVSVFQRGSINVICAAGNPKTGQPVYIRIAAGVGLNVGDLTSVIDDANTVLLANAQWGGAADINKVAELVLLTRANA